MSSSEDSTRRRRPGARSRSTTDTSRPTTLTRPWDSAGQRIAARANATDETAGRISTLSGPRMSMRTEPMPETNGSPDASTTTVVSR